ncbi:MAG: DUF1893 domain-containing protein [Firmicutes bacterium]|nr:DUF1893 domain-containing protein [Bacillota bacterium]
MNTYKIYKLNQNVKDLLEQYHIDYSYDYLVPYITNRDKNRMCSLEASVLDVDDLEQGFKIICREMIEKNK